MWIAGDGWVDDAEVVAWVCAGDGTAATALVREFMGGAGAGVCPSDGFGTSPSRLRLTPRVVLSLRPSDVALRRIWCLNIESQCHIKIDERSCEPCAGVAPLANNPIPVNLV